MKNIQTGFLLSVVIASLFYNGCVNPHSPAGAADSEKDTLYITLLQTCIHNNPGTLYRYLSRNQQLTFDTVYSGTPPPSTELIPFDFSGNCTLWPPPQIIPVEITLPVYDTLYRFIDNFSSHDTVFISDTTIRVITTYSDTIDCFIDFINTYRRSIRPLFISKDSIAGILSTAQEGCTQYIHLDILHIEDDSVEISLLNTPPWVDLFRMNLFEGFDDCWFYPLCEDGTRIREVCPHWIAERMAPTDNYIECFKPYIRFNADSTALDSVYTWQVVLTNKYDQSDTLDISTVVERFPDSLRCW